MDTPLRRPRPERSAFTLVELLVVIGIIAVLVGILLPTLSSARRQANLVKCSSNMRQIASAMLMNASERQGYMPLIGAIRVATATTGLNDIPTALGDPGRRRYSYSMSHTGTYYTPIPVVAALAPYLQRGSVVPTDNANAVEAFMNSPDGPWKMFMCPSTDSFSRQTSIISGMNVPAEQGSVIVVFLGTSGSPTLWWSSNSDYVFNEGVFGFEATNTTRRFRGQLNKVALPAQSILFTDGKRRNGAAAPSVSDGWQTWTPSLTSTRTAPLSASLDGSNFVTDASSFDRLRHKNRINIAFADGHVETRTIAVADLTNVYIIPPTRR